MNIKKYKPYCKICRFTDLRVWKKGHELVVMIYKTTGEFPKKETYSLIDQMRRSSSSITSNIAEGFGRKGYKEKLQFYYQAHGSLTELENQILISKDVGYLTDKEFKTLANQAKNTHQLLLGLIRKTKSFINQKS